MRLGLQACEAWCAAVGVAWCNVVPPRHTHLLPTAVLLRLSKHRRLQLRIRSSECLTV